MWLFMDMKNGDFARIAKNTYKTTAEQCARLTGISGLIQEERKHNVTCRSGSTFILAGLYSSWIEA